MPNVDQEEVAQFHRLVREHEMLLEACEAEEAVFQHRMSCVDCRWQGVYCPKTIALIE